MVDKRRVCDHVFLRSFAKIRRSRWSKISTLLTVKTTEKRKKRLQANFVNVKNHRGEKKSSDQGLKPCAQIFIPSSSFAHVLCKKHFWPLWSRVLKNLPTQWEKSGRTSWLRPKTRSLGARKNRYTRSKERKPAKVCKESSWLASTFLHSGQFSKRTCTNVLASCVKTDLVNSKNFSAQKYYVTQKVLDISLHTVHTKRNVQNLLGHTVGQ